MPPKKTGSKAVAAKEKAVEEKTFGLKNKKGAKQQKFVQQVKQSVEGGKHQRGPSKKEAKELQKAQEAEMMALFNIVPKKKEEESTKQELDPDTGPTFTDITQEIEYQRANVVAKTKITDAVFQDWRARKMAARRAAEEEARRERHRRGALTGREIFLEAGEAGIVDDDTAAGDDDMIREIDEEEEIRRMEALSLAAQRDAWTEAGLKPPVSEEAAGAATETATGLVLSKEDQEDLFDDDDDDVDLDELENQVQNEQA